ncbi:hypothetical protein D3C76_558170 [compost metagenome]|uniref:hypothetical protein n=1 Tax=Pseudomonas TaxID=286 RepID=UPI000F954620
MDLEDRVEALEYLVCLLAQEVDKNSGPMRGLESKISSALFSTSLDYEKRQQIEQALQSVLRKVRRSHSGIDLC